MRIHQLYYLFVLATLLLPALSGANCASVAADSEAAKNHDSRIYVVLKGPFSSGESANAFVDGQSIGVVTPSASQYIRVDTGAHSISVSTITIPTTFTTNVNIPSNHEFTFNIECDYAKVTLKADGLYALDNTKLTVFIDGINSGVMLPGQPLTLTMVAPGKYRVFRFVDDSNKLRYSTTMTIQYKSTNSITVPYL